MVQGSDEIVPHWELGIGPISCHAWNKDGTQLAVSPSNNEIHIFHRSTDGGWRSEHILREHDLYITGLDWAPNTNRIVSCSHDKNAFVWTWDDSLVQWKPELVLVRANRAATCVRWSPQENKFAVGSAARLVAICYYERENDWWVSKQIKKPIRSSVTALDWHPNNILLSVGACDFRIRVFSAYVKEVDDKPAPNPWGTKMPFGELLKEYSALGWVHDLAFSPSGCKLAWVSHDSTLSLLDKSNPLQLDPISCRNKFLPFVSLKWMSEQTIIAAGYDCSPMLFKVDGNTIMMDCKMDVPLASKGDMNVSSAFQMFRNFDRKAVAESGTNSPVQLKTLHQNSITQVKAIPAGQSGGRSSKFSSCALDGVLAIWDVQEVLEYCQNRINSAPQNGSILS